MKDCHDNRMNLTPYERDTLEHVLDFALGLLNYEIGCGKSQTTAFALRLSKVKVLRLKLKIFPPTQAREPKHE